MASARKNTDLASQVHAIVADAVERVRVLMASELTRGLGRTPPAARKNGKPGRKPSYSPDQVDRLVELVKRKGTLAPRDARKALHVTSTQLAGMVRAALVEGRMQVQGKGRGTHYIR